MRTLIAAAAAAVLLAGAPLAAAHQGNPNMRSEVTAITPKTDGVTVTVLNNDDRLELHNTSGKDIVIAGYEDEPYARVLGDGTVEVNTNSEAHYLNDDRYGDVKVPANLGSEPKWKRLSKTGRFEWHDHRMHWMSQQPPSQVQGVTKKTKIFDWTVPLKVGATAGAIKGTLFWTPQVQSGPPAMAINLLVGLVILVCIGIAVVRRRRTPSAPASASAPAKEAW